MTARYGYLTALTLLVFVGPALAGDEALSRIPLRDITQSDAAPADPAGASALPVMEAHLETAKTQPDVGQGLVFVLSIKNMSSRTQSLRNPEDFLQVQLSDEEGYPVSLPPVPTSPLVCTKDHQGGDSAEETGLVKPFEARRREVAKGAETKNVAERDVIELAPDETYRLSLSIAEVLADPKSYAADLVQRSDDPTTGAAPSSPSYRSIPAGKYKLRVLLPLVDSHGSASPVMLQSEEIEIVLGTQ